MIDWPKISLKDLSGFIFEKTWSSSEGHEEKFKIFAQPLSYSNKRNRSDDSLFKKNNFIH